MMTDSDSETHSSFPNYLLLKVYFSFKALYLLFYTLQLFNQTRYRIGVGRKLLTELGHEGEKGGNKNKESKTRFCLETIFGRKSIPLLHL